LIRGLKVMNSMGEFNKKDDLRGQLLWWRLESLMFSQAPRERGKGD